MRLAFSLVTIAALASRGEAARGKKKTTTIEAPSLDTFIWQATEMTREMKSNYGALAASFSTYCKFFENMPTQRTLREDEVIVYTFIIQKYCNMLITVLAHDATIEVKLGELSHISDLEAMSSFLDAQFEHSVEIQESIRKLFEEYKGVSDGLDLLQRRSHSVFDIKSRELKKIVISQKDKWPALTDAIYKLSNAVKNVMPSAPAGEAVMDEVQDKPHSTAERSSEVVVKVAAKEETGAVPSPIRAASDSLMLATVDVKKSLHTFFEAYGELRRVLGDGEEVKQKLDELLVFPATRAVAWERFSHQLAAFLNSIQEEI
jgi:hypothetical protein